MSIRIDGTNTTANPGITGGDADTGLQFGTDEVSIVTGGTEQVKVDSSGRLLVGTSSTAAGQLLTVQGSIGDASGIAKICRSNASPAATASLGILDFSDSGHVTAVRIRAQRDSGTWTSGSSQPSALTFSTTADGASSPTERMRISSNGICSLPDGGKLGIGTASAIMSSSGRLRIHGDFFNGASGIALSTTNNTNGAVFIDFGNSSGTRVGEIERASSTTIAYRTSSDYRLKENVTAFTDGITRLKQLNPVRYSWIIDEKSEADQDGFLAHEVQDVVPIAAGGKKDEVDDNGKIVPQGIDHSLLVPLLTAALQEAIAKIETLEASNAALEARLTALEGGAS